MLVKFNEFSLDDLVVPKKNKHNRINGKFQSIHGLVQPFIHCLRWVSVSYPTRIEIHWSQLSSASRFSTMVKLRLTHDFIWVNTTISANPHNNRINLNRYCYYYYYQRMDMMLL